MLILITAIAYVCLAWFSLRGESRIRLVAAFLLAPLAPCLIFAVVAGNFLWAVVAAPFAYLFALAGVPVYFLFRRLGWLKIWQVVPASATLGGAVAFVGGFSHLSSNGSVPNIHNALQFVGYGALAGLVFWLVAFAGQRPNNSFKPKPLRGSA